MTLLAAADLDPKLFFKDGDTPVRQGSSFDLTIGTIYDAEGKETEGPFLLKPNHIVQVVSAETFNLSADVTGHVTYKTGMTSVGVWALTVGIVDPGWNGPISTTLLNFSSRPALIEKGHAFLRVSFFRHDPVEEKLMRRTASVAEYHRDVRSAAATTFPTTFLDRDTIVEAAGRQAVGQIRRRALGWATAIAVLFAAIQIVTSYAQPTFWFRPEQVSREELFELKNELESLREQIARSSSPNSGESSPVQSPDELASGNSAAPGQEHDDTRLPLIDTPVLETSQEN
jgi:deoxycytidine triphosphate deaminase